MGKKKCQRHLREKHTVTTKQQPLFNKNNDHKLSQTLEFQVKKSSMENSNLLLSNSENISAAVTIQHSTFLPKLDQYTEEMTKFHRYKDHKRARKRRSNKEIKRKLQHNQQNFYYETTSNFHFVFHQQQSCLSLSEAKLILASFSSQGLGHRDVNPARKFRSTD